MRRAGKPAATIGPGAGATCAKAVSTKTAKLIEAKPAIRIRCMALLPVSPKMPRRGAQIVMLFALTAIRYYATWDRYLCIVTIMQRTDFTEPRRRSAEDATSAAIAYRCPRELPALGHLHKQDIAGRGGRADEVENLPSRYSEVFGHVCRSHYCVGRCASASRRNNRKVIHGNKRVIAVRNRNFLANHERLAKILFE